MLALDSRLRATLDALEEIWSRFSSENRDLGDPTPTGALQVDPVKAALEELESYVFV